MTERPNWREMVLDAFVYAPTGLAITVVEELPQLVDKGRRRIEGRITTARVVGQFAWQFARQQLGQGAGGFGSPFGGIGHSRPAHQQAASPTAAEPAATAPQPPTRATEPVGGEADEGRGSAVADIRQASAARKARSSSSGSGRVRSAGSRPPAAADVGGSPAGADRGSSAGSGAGAVGGIDDAVGISGYDSLSASQVVQRLGGLTASQLRAVQAHEQAGRHRRTVLHRVDQLLAESDQR
jgi:hypothetical protein